MKLLTAAALGSVLIVSACASATTTVLEPPSQRLSAQTISIERADDTVAIEAENDAYFRERLEKELYDDGRFSPGEELKLQYRFIQLDEGSRAARYLVGPFGGKGTLTIEMTYLDPSGAELAKIHTGGEIQGGVFGGSFKSALDKAAKETAEYAVANFK